jgi:hypothetical protein
VDIVITKGNFQILIDVVITNLIRLDLVQHVFMTTTHATTFVAQDKA